MISLARPSISWHVLPLCPQHNLAGILHGVAERNRRLAEDYVAVFVEHRNHIVALQQSLPTFVVEREYKIRFVQAVRDGYLQASLIQGLDDFRRLRTRTAGVRAGRPPSILISAPCRIPAGFPRLAISDQYSHFAIAG